MKGVSMAAWLILIGLFLPTSQAASQTGTAIDAVRAMLDEVMAIQNDPKLAGLQSRDTRRDLIKKVIIKNFDFAGMAKDTLGPGEWATLSPGQRSEFASVFQDLFVDSYSRLVLDFLKKEKIEYRGQEPDQGRMMVRTVISRAEDRIPVDYLSSRHDAWSVRDVTIDGVSIVANYRRSFSRVIKEESYGGLLKKMRLQQKAAHAEEPKAKP